MSNTNFNEMRSGLIEALLTIKTAKHAHNEIVMRCPYCGDSKKHASSRHFYIKIPNIEGDLPVFYCHLCNTKGIINSKTLNSWIDGRFEMPQVLNGYIKESSKLAQNRKYKKTSTYRLKLPMVSEDPYSMRKIDYINRRLGINLSPMDIRKFKIVLNLYDLLNLNGITSLPVKQNYADLIDEDCFGVLSTDNAYITFRNIGTRIDKRHIKYNIFGLWDNTKSFYVMPYELDLLNTNPVHVHIAEGFMTLLGVYHHVTHGSEGVYAASMGTGFAFMIKYLISLGLYDAIFHIYPDMDKGMQYYEYSQKLKNDIGPYRLLYPLVIRQNVYPGEKDFGVTSDKIQLRQYEG